MNLVGEITYNYRAYRRIVLPPARRRWTVRVTGVLALACGGWLAFFDEGLDQNTIVPMVLGLALLLLPELIIPLGWQRMRKLQPFRYQLSDAGMTIETSQTSATFQWQGIAKVDASRHAWVLTNAATKQRIPIPRAAFAPRHRHRSTRTSRDFPAH
jgi:hypothetical protein